MVSKRSIFLKVKAKCDECGTVTMLDNINDIMLYDGVSFEGDHKCSAFRYECPYCAKVPMISYRNCKKIQKWMDTLYVTKDTLRKFDSLAYWKQNHLT